MIFSALRHAFHNMSDSEIHSTLSRSVCHRPGRGGDHDWKGHLSVRKHKSLRSALIECAWQAVQNDPAMLLKYGVGRYRSRVYGLALPGCATSTFVMCYVDLAVPIIY